MCTDNNKNAHRNSIICIVLLQSTYFRDQINVSIVSFGNVYEEGRTNRMWKVAHAGFIFFVQVYWGQAILLQSMEAKTDQYGWLME